MQISVVLIFPTVIRFEDVGLSRCETGLLLQSTIDDDSYAVERNRSSFIKMRFKLFAEQKGNFNYCLKSLCAIRQVFEFVNGVGATGSLNFQPLP
jgi:hypothetical protein